MAGTFAYVASTGSGEIAVFALDADARRLEPVETVSFGVGGADTNPMSVSPDRRFLHVAVRRRPQQLATYAIDGGTGRLSRVGAGALPESMPYITLDATGRYLIAASYSAHSVTVGEMGSDGMLARTLGTLENIPNAHAVVLDRGNRFALVPSLGSDEVRVLAFVDTSGLLARHGEVSLPERSGPRHLAWHPRLDRAYVIGEHDARVHVLDYDAATGTLVLERSVASKPAGAPPEGTWAAADIHVTPDGRWLFASVRRDSTIAVFALDADGTPSLSATYETEARPRGIALDPSGRFLLVAGQDSAAVAFYEIDSDIGALELIDRYRVGENPNWIEIIDLP